MKNTLKFIGLAVIAVIVFSTTACTGGSSGGGKSINSAGALKEYLDSCPANSPDKPIRVSMGANVNMLKDIAKAIQDSGKYVSLNLTGSALTSIEARAFRNCTTLVGITIPNIHAV